MRVFGALMLGVFGGLSISYASAALDWGFAVNAQTPAAGRTAVQWVDRSHKGDRIDIHSTRVGKQPTPAPKLLVGCEPVSSPLSSVHATLPGRCAT